MTLTNRIYLAVHSVFTILVCARYDIVAHWQRYVVWNLIAIAAIVSVSNKRMDGRVWEFAHDWLPLVFFVTVFEEVSFLSLTLRGAWQNSLLVSWEAALFGELLTRWLHNFSNPWLTELMEFGYFTFYPLYPTVGGILWAWRKRPRFVGAFQRLTDSLSVGYVVCYIIFLLFPTRSPTHNVGLDLLPAPHAGGPFGALVRIIQSHAGVHGNAFPSAHIMLAVVVVCFTFRYFPRLAWPLLVCIPLMCFASAYDGYHYVVDVVAGAFLGVTVGGFFLTVDSSGRRPPLPSRN